MGIPGHQLYSRRTIPFRRRGASKHGGNKFTGEYIAPWSTGDSTDTECRGSYRDASNFELVYSWGFFVAAINSRLPARRWRKKDERGAPSEIAATRWKKREAGLDRARDRSRRGTGAGKRAWNARTRARRGRRRRGEITHAASGITAL